MNSNLSRLCPHGLYLRLNLSNRWNMLVSAYFFEDLVRTHVNIQSVHGKLERLQVETLKYLLQCEHTPVAYDDLFLPTLPQLTLYKLEQVLLIHGARVMNVSVHFPHVVKVPMWNVLGCNILQAFV